MDLNSEEFDFAS